MEKETEGGGRKGWAGAAVGAEGVEEAKRRRRGGEENEEDLWL